MTAVEETRARDDVPTESVMHIDLTTFCLWIALGLLSWALLGVMVAGAVAFMRYLEGLTFS